MVVVPEADVDMVEQMFVERGAPQIQVVGTRDMEYILFKYHGPHAPHYYYRGRGRKRAGLGGGSAHGAHQTLIG